MKVALPTFIAFGLFGCLVLSQGRYIFWQRFDSKDTTVKMDFVRDRVSYRVHNDASNGVADLSPSPIIPLDSSPPSDPKQGIMRARNQGLKKLREIEDGHDSDEKQIEALINNLDNLSEEVQIATLQRIRKLPIQAVTIDKIREKFLLSVNADLVDECIQEMMRHRDKASVEKSFKFISYHLIRGGYNASLKVAERMLDWNHPLVEKHLRQILREISPTSEQSQVLGSVLDEITKRRLGA